MSNSLLKFSRTFYRTGLLSRFNSSQFSNAQLKSKKISDTGKDDRSSKLLKITVENPITDNANRLLLRGDINAVFMSKSGYRIKLAVRYSLQTQIRRTTYAITYLNEDFGQDLVTFMNSLRVGDNVTIEAALFPLRAKHIVSLKGSYIEKHER